MAESNVGLVAHTVSTPACSDWLLTLHSGHWGEKAERLLRVGTRRATFLVRRRKPAAQVSHPESCRTPSSAADPQETFVSSLAPRQVSKRSCLLTLTLTANCSAKAYAALGTTLWLIPLQGHPLDQCPEGETVDMMLGARINRPRPL